MSSQQKNHYQENIMANFNFIDINFQGKPRNIADTSLDDLRVSYIGLQQTLNHNWKYI